MTIPPRVHFVWIGTQLPWAYVFAVLSAAARSDMDEVILHHTDALADSAELQALKAATGVRLNRIDPTALLAEAGSAARTLRHAGRYRPGNGAGGSSVAYPVGYLAGDARDARRNPWRRSN